ncbi:DUF6266 family protein [Pedobacter immunditicola]|uniref:DUF6266 family protein n=1 Tax=Pedobacter immunditicola TaxID=3133440 RepID=UPI0030B2ED08
MPLKSAKAPTQPQVNQRRKFRLVSSFLSPISELIITGFVSRKGDPGPMQMAMAFNLAHAIEGNSPDFGLDYTKVRFSNGKLASPDHTAIEALPGCTVEFSWVDDDQPFNHCFTSLLL